jgi:predicted esterase
MKNKIIQYTNSKKWYILTVIFLMGCSLEIDDSPKENPYLSYYSIETHDGKYLRFACISPETHNVIKGNPVLLIFPPGEQSEEEVKWTIDNYLIRQCIQRNWIVISPMAVEDKKYFEGAEEYIPELLDWIEDSFNVENNSFHISGISNGGKSAFRIGIQYRKKCSSLLVFPGIIHNNTEYALLDSLIGIPVHMYVGEYENQAWKSVMDSIKIILDDLGVTNQYIVFPGEGHVLTSLTSIMLFDTLDSFRPDSN